MVSLQAKFFTPNIQFRFILKSDHLFNISSLFGQIQFHSTKFNKANRFFSSCLLEFQNRNFHCYKFSLLEISLEFPFEQYFEKTPGPFVLLVHIVIYLSLRAERHAIKNHLKLVKEYCFIRR